MGFPYWMYIRFTVCESLFGERMLAESKVSRTFQVSLGKRIVCSLQDIIKDLKLLLFGKRTDFILFRQNELKDSFFDSWKLPNNSKTYSFYVEEKLDKYKSGNHYFGIPRIESGIKRRVTLRKRGNIYDIEERRFLQLLEKKLKNKYGQCISWQNMEETIQEARLIHNIYKKYFSKIFSKLNCKILITIVYYQPVLFPAYEAAKELGIQVVELQHGVINNHISYMFKDDNYHNIIVPDILLTFGDIHNTWVKLCNQTKAVAIGFPSQEKLIKQYEVIIPRENTIIFYPEPFSNYETLIDEFIKKNKKYDILIKLHPLQFGHIKEYFPILSKNKKAVFIDNQDKDIYYWLKYAKHHVMISSTVGLEAMAFDHCNVCIYENAPHEQTQCLLDWKIARGFNTAGELSLLIDNPMEERTDLRDVRNSLWKRHAKRNMESFFENAIKDWKGKSYDT